MHLTLRFGFFRLWLAMLPFKMVDPIQDSLAGVPALVRPLGSTRLIFPLATLPFALRVGIRVRNADRDLVSVLHFQVCIVLLSESEP